MVTKIEPAARRRRTALLAVVVTAGIGAGIAAWAQEKNPGYLDTPMLPGGKWHVHDSRRPQPKVVTPASRRHPGDPPSDAVVLFNGKNLAQWQSPGGKPAAWKVQDGYLECIPGKGDLTTRGTWDNYQLHIEFAEPNPPVGHSQERGNSGIFLFGRYELQVMDGYNNPTYADGQVGALYGQVPPLSNPSRPPGEWQTYDILVTGPKFAADKLISPLYVTVLFNGVAVQNHAEGIGSTVHHALAKYAPHPEKGPIGLQDHHNAIRYRNIWVRELKSSDGP